MPRYAQDRFSGQAKLLKVFWTLAFVQLVRHGRKTCNVARGAGNCGCSYCVHAWTVTNPLDNRFVSTPKKVNEIKLDKLDTFSPLKGPSGVCPPGPAMGPLKKISNCQIWILDALLAKRRPNLAPLWGYPEQVRPMRPILSLLHGLDFP
jgi:hypothetical protein